MDQEDYCILRSRKVTPAALQRFSREPPRYLFYTNEDVNKCNGLHYAALPLEDRYAFAALDVGRHVTTDGLFMTQATLPSTVYLGIGAEVMFMAGGQLHEVGLPCGLRGRVVAFVATEQGRPLPVVYLPSHDLQIIVHPEEEAIMRHNVRIGHRLQLPLRLAWGATIHTEQGQTIQGPLVVSLKGCAVPGLLYVALSRATTLTNLYVVDLPEPVREGRQGPTLLDIPDSLQRAGPHPDAQCWCKEHNVFSS